jgi:hypothetical protein
VDVECLAQFVEAHQAGGGRRVRVEPVEAARHGQLVQDDGEFRDVEQVRLLAHGHVVRGHRHLVVVPGDQLRQERKARDVDVRTGAEVLG